jgi:DNA processing protein
MVSDIRYWLGFNLVPRIGPVRLRALLSYFKDIELAWRADPPTLRAAKLPPDAIDKLVSVRSHINLDDELAKVAKAGLKLVCWESPDYPSLLQRIDQPPPLLYVCGNLQVIDELAVAIVGTRNPTSYGKEVARHLTTDLTRNKVTIVSGLALGIDGIAHQAALDAGGRTLAVLGCGLDWTYPASHRSLAEHITHSGALISDYPLGTKPEAINFPPRNRIISGLTLGTVVVEAGMDSGALITLQFALDQGRDTFAVPGSIFSRASAGTNAAIMQGKAKLVAGAEDILNELNLNMIIQQEEVREVIPATPTETLLLGIISQEPLHIDEIVRQANLSIAAVSSTLCLMELKGMVLRVDNSRYTLGHHLT